MPLRIGALPTKTSLELSVEGGDRTPLPAATASAAGIMTAEQARMLEECYRRIMGTGSGPIVIEKPAITDHLVTKDELRALVTTISARSGGDATDSIRSLRAELLRLQGQVEEVSRPLLEAPSSPGEVVDERARAILDHVLEGFGGLENRITQVEAFVEALRAIIEIKAEESPSQEVAA